MTTSTVNPKASASRPSALFGTLNSPRGIFGGGGGGSKKMLIRFEDEVEMTRWLDELSVRRVTARHGTQRHGTGNGTQPHATTARWLDAPPCPCRPWQMHM